jgi:hypothetical protein
MSDTENQPQTLYYHNGAFMLWDGRIQVLSQLKLYSIILAALFIAFGSTAYYLSRQGPVETQLVWACISCLAVVVVWFNVSTVIIPWVRRTRARHG